MTNFEYKPIGLEGPAFRLLRVLKGSDNDPIQCQLFESKIPSSEYIINYAALSYTWGSESRPCDIIINGSKMIVTKNAYLALRDLRYQEKDRVLWVDTLSINQNDRNEKGQQVQQMGSIYSKAERVIIWLGEATYDTDYIMYYMEQLEKESTKHASDDQEISKQWVDIWSTMVRDLRHDQMDLLVEGLQSLLSRNWFKRAWVIQETSNARAADIVCGGKSVPARIFALMPALLRISPDLHCQSIIDIMPGSPRDSSWWAKKRDLYTLLDKFRNSEATKPQDRIYALLGISSDACDTDLLRADYEKDLRDVIFDTTSFLLNLNEVHPRIYRFFDRSLTDFLGNLDTLANEVLKCGMNAGHEWAAENGHGAVVELLLEKGAELETEDEVGRTPLSWAAANGHEAVVELLLEKGAKLKTKDRYGQTPLSWAVKNGHEAVVELLLEEGVKLETKDKYDQTPLSWAATNGHEAVVELLLEKGVKLETKDKYGQTPLSWAIKNGHEAVMKLLLEKGTELKTKDEHGQTPLSWAAANGHEAVVKLLLEKGAELETMDVYGQAPLFYTIRNKHETKDRYGQTPLSWAVKNGHWAVAKLLLEKGAKVS